jgi:uncharacterized protein with PIN domain
MTLCPVQTLQIQAVSLGGEMLRTLRRLRLETAACPACPQTLDCPTRDELNAQIETAIGEVASEWELSTCLRV